MRVAVPASVVLAVLAPLLVAVSSSAVRVVEPSVLLLLGGRASDTLLQRGRSVLRARSATLALGSLRLESLIGGGSLRSSTSSRSGRRRVHAEEVVQTGRALGLVRLGSLLLLLLLLVALQLGFSESADTERRLVVKVGRRVRGRSTVWRMRRGRGRLGSLRDRGRRSLRGGLTVDAASSTSKGVVLLEARVRSLTICQ